MRKEIEEEFKKLPAFVQDQFNKTFKEHETYKSLTAQAEHYQRMGNFIVALEIKKRLELIKEDAVENLINTEQSEVRVLKSTDLGLNRKEVDEVNELQIALYTLCDVMDSIILDMNSLLCNKDESVSFTMFDDVKELGERVKQRIEYVEKELGLVKDGDMYKHSDNLYEMVMNKARSIYKTYKNRKTEEAKEVL